MEYHSLADPIYELPEDDRELAFEKVNKIFFLTLAYVIFFPGILSFFFWIKGVALIGANRAGVYLHLMPILGAIMAMIIFGEKIMLYHFLGAIFIVAGITLSNKKIRKNA